MSLYTLQHPPCLQETSEPAWYALKDYQVATDHVYSQISSTCQLYLAAESLDERSLLIQSCLSWNLINRDFVSHINN